MADISAPFFVKQNKKFFLPITKFFIHLSARLLSIETAIESRYIAEVKRMHGIKMLNSRSVDNTVCTKTVLKNVQQAIEMALVHFNIIKEEQVTKL